MLPVKTCFLLSPCSRIQVGSLPECKIPFCAVWGASSTGRFSVQSHAGLGTGMGSSPGVGPRALSVSLDSLQQPQSLCWGARAVPEGALCAPRAPALAVPCRVSQRARRSFPRVTLTKLVWNFWLYKCVSPRWESRQLVLKINLLIKIISTRRDNHQNQTLLCFSECVWVWHE